MKLTATPQSSLTPYILSVMDPTMPATAPRVVARCDTRDGKIWRTKGSAVTATMTEIREAVAAYEATS